MKRNHFLTIDTETTQTGMVADFGATISDVKGNILNQCAVLTGGIYTDPVNHPLFFSDDPKADKLWHSENLEGRYSAYRRMIKSGTRMIASIPAINNWLAKAATAYRPILTAYNLPFDLSKCTNTGINLTLFDRSFCMWRASYSVFAQTRKYRQMVLDCHAFNAPTPLGNMSFKTNAETMARFILNNPELPDEPHTALEDIVFYELPILNGLLRRKSVKWLLTQPEDFNWRSVQVREWFKPC